MKLHYSGSNEKKNIRKEQGQDLLKASRKWIVWTQNVKIKLNNMEQVQMEYWEMDI